MIPTLEEWLENKEFEGYKFSALQSLIRALVDYFLGDRTALVRYMRRTLVEWAKARGYNP